MTRDRRAEHTTRSGRQHGPDDAARSGQEHGPDDAARSGQERGPDDAARSGQEHGPDDAAPRAYVPPPLPLSRRVALLKEPLARGATAENPVIVQVLGVCSALAVTGRMDTTFVMCGALVFVCTLSCVAVSLLRRLTPLRARMITYMLVIATLVIVVDQYLKAHHFPLSKALGPYVGLIITNCIVMARCEVFASRNPTARAAADGFANAVGYGLVLCAVALVREPLGNGTLLGYRIAPESFEPCQLMALAPGAFLAMGCLVWLVRARWPEEETALAP